MQSKNHQVAVLAAELSVHLMRLDYEERLAKAKQTVAKLKEGKLSPEAYRKNPIKPFGRKQK